MNKTTRIIVSTTAALTLAIGGGFAGYTIGHNANATENAQAIKAAQCDAIRGLDLTPKVPFKAPTPACVWGYQVTVASVLTDPSRCYCG